ncbi:MAG: ABC transporter permease [Kiritimatiellae bacterium]|nr:ABC transporter permease [Kiritimatiellia bacterium]
MRRFWAIVRATALETISEPLALLLTLGAAVMIVLPSVFSFHQFGEPTRMARDAGLSSLMVFGSAYAVFCTIKVFRREIESGTAQMALSHPVSRAEFLCAKVAGVVAASSVFALAVGGVAAAVISGAEAGGCAATAEGGLTTIWNPALFSVVGVFAASLAIAAALNGFFRFRFTTTASSLMAFLSPVTAYAVWLAGRSFAASKMAASGFSSGVPFDTSVRFLPAAVAVILPVPVFVSASAAFSVRFKDHAAASLSCLLFLVSLPAMGNYYMSEALADGGTVPWTRVALAWAATLPFLAAFLLLGTCLFKDRDVG